MRIALVSDTHTTRGTTDDQPRYKGHLDQVIAQVNAAQVDVVLIAGDLTDDGQEQERQDFQAQVKGFAAPILIIPGNHDIGDKVTQEKPTTVTSDRITAFEQVYGPSFWIDTRFGVRILGINASILGSGLPREAEQWRFLKRELAHPSPLPTILLTHYPLFIQALDEPSSLYWNIEPEPRKCLLILLKQAGIRTVLSGHLHRPLSFHIDGITYITTLPVSFGLPFGVQPEGWTLVTIAPNGAAHSETREITH